MTSKMLLEAAILLNDVHLELEDADHDVIHEVIVIHDVIHADHDVIHEVIPPLKVVMKKLRMTK